MKSKILAVCTSKEKGTAKRDIGSCQIVEGYGLEHDAHGGDWHRQVSLLAMESIRKMLDKGVKLQHGDFGENLVTEGIELVTIPVGTRLKIGKEVILQVSQIGKECHTPCNIYYNVGFCIMPTEGIFATVVKGGEVKVGDEIKTME